ncbi:MAG: DUF177 domain-containing protein [Dehalococcoidales bacterium]|nr:DUF177 domain-containing protein [Dehalococcoidales bacterium]
MLQINVSQLLKGPIGSTEDHQMSGTVEIDGNTSQTQGRVSLTRTNRGILVRGTIDTSVEVSCARCLNSFSCPLALDIKEEFYPATDTASGQLPAPEDADAFTVDEHQVIDLAEVVRQYGLTTLPMKPLCREDCTGLQKCSPTANKLTE